MISCVNSLYFLYLEVKGAGRVLITVTLSYHLFSMYHIYIDLEGYFFLSVGI